MTLQLSFNCNSQHSNLVVTSADSISISTQLLIVPSAITISEVNYFAGPMLYGQTFTDTFMICGSGLSKIYNLTIDFGPSYEIGGCSLSVGGPDAFWSYGSMFSYSVATPFQTTISSSEIQELLGNQNFLDDTACIFLIESGTANTCYITSTDASSVISVSTSCSGDVCTPSHQASDGVSLADDYTTKDNSPISISSPTFLQNGSNVTSGGINPCDSFVIQYSIKNPRDHNTSLAQEANFKYLEQFVLDFRPSWFDAGLYVTINNGIPIASTTGTGVLTVDFTTALTNAVANQITDTSNMPFLNNSRVFWPMLSPNPVLTGIDNTILDNQAFTISIHAQVNPDNNDVAACSLGAADFQVLGQPTLSYYTMCGHFNQVTNNVSGYSNIMGTGVYGNAKPENAAEGGTDTLNFCWQQHSGSGNPWYFTNDSLHPFFNCPYATYEIALELSPAYTLNTSSLRFTLPDSTTSYALSSSVQNDSNYILTGSIYSSGCLSAAVTFTPGNDPGFCHGQGGMDTSFAKLLAYCPGCSAIPYCIGEVENQLSYHCSGPCNGPIGIPDHGGITQISVTRDTIASESLHTGLAATNRAYPCDEIDIMAEGQATDSAGITPDSIFLQITYPYQISTNTIFSAVGADYRFHTDTGWSSWITLGANHVWGPYTNSNGLFEFDASLPHSCADTDSISAFLFYHSDSFFVRLHVEVNNNLPQINGTYGVYQVQGIQANLCMRDCAGVLYNSCDPASGGLLIIDPVLTDTVEFLAPDNKAFYPHTYTDICTQRLLIQSTATGGFASGAEMPNELRPMFIWPTDSTREDTLTISNFTSPLSSPADMHVNLIQFIYPTQFSNPMNIPLDNLHFKDTLGVIQIYGITLPDSSIGWPVFGKDGPDYMGLLVVFDKLTCANESETPLVTCKLWSRGMYSCVTPSTYFNYPNVDSVAIFKRPTTKNTVATVTLETANSSGVYGVSSNVNLGSTGSENGSNLAFSEAGEMVYQGDSAGVNSTWMYVSSLDSFPGYIWFDNDTLIDGHYYFYPSSFLYPDSEIQHFTFSGVIDTSVANCVTGNVYAIRLVSGYSCNPDSLHTLTGPALTDSNTCGYTTSIMNIKLDTTGISVAVLTGPQVERGCDTLKVQVKITATNSAPLFDPDLLIAVPAGVEITSVHLENYLHHADSLVIIPGITQRYGADTISLLGDTTNGLTDFEYLDSVGFGGHPKFLPADSSMLATIYFTVDTRDSSACAYGSQHITFTAQGKNLCGKTVASTYEGESVMFYPFTCPACNECKNFPFSFNAAEDTITCNGSNGKIALDVTGGSPGSGLTYKWRFPNGDTLVTPDTITVLSNLSQQGTYYVTVTDTNHCSAKDTIRLVAAPHSYTCCFNNPDTNIIVINQDTLSSQDSIPPGSFVYVAPGVTLTVNTNLTLQQCQFVMGGNSRIIIRGSDTLKILGSVLKACDTMWYGIIDTGSIYIDQYDGDTSIIEDAVLGVNLVSRANHIVIKNTHFCQNFISLVYEIESTTDTTDYQLSNCYFGLGVGSMLPPPAGSGIIRTTHPYLGIWIENLWGLQIPNINRPDSHSNTFENMNAGVFVHGTQTKIYGNYFRNIYLYDTAAVNFAFDNFCLGGAVSADAGAFNRITLVVQTDSLYPDSNSVPAFSNCDYGIKCQATNLLAYKNRLDNVTNSIYVQGCLQNNININHNYITRTNYGVSLLNNSSSTQKVDSNTIHVNPPLNQNILVSHIFFFMGHPIHLFTDSAYLTNTYGITQTDVTASSSSLTYNTVYGGRNCINLTGTRNTNIKDNILYQTDTTVVGGAQAGLYAANCTGLYVIDNYCYGNGNSFDGTPNSATSAIATSAHRKSGFSFYNCSVGCQVCDNVLGGTAASAGVGYGMLISSYCDHLVLANNNFEQSYYSIALQSSGIANVLGDQGGIGLSSENSFIGNGTGYFAGGDRTASYISIIDSNYHAPIFYYNTAIPLTNPEPGYAYYNGYSNSLEAITGDPVTIVDGLTYDLCSVEWQNPITFPINITTRISLMDSAVAGGNTKKILEPGFDSTSVWLAQKMLYESLYNDSAALDTNSLMNAFYNSMANSDIATILQSEIENIMLTDSANLTDGIAYSKFLETAQSTSSDVPDSNIRAANYIAMSNIYLNTIASGIVTFTSGQLDTIAQLAMQCPYTAGDAVYIARSLYTQYDNTVFFDDLVLCTPVVMDSTRMLRALDKARDTSAVASSVSDYILVYPNPAKNILKVFYSSAGNASITFDLTDMMGQKIVSVPVTNLSTIDIDVSNMADGLYLWKGRNGIVPIQAGKVSIQR